VRYYIELENQFLSSRCHLKKPVPTGMGSDGIAFNCQRPGTGGRVITTWGSIEIGLPAG
jgi:hypothetical protein